MALPLIRLARKAEVAEGTTAFQFEKPVGFEFDARRFGDDTLQDPSATGGESGTRGLPLSSARFEQHLVSTARLRDTAFKRVLRDAPIGSQVALDTPRALLTWHSNTARPAVFLTEDMLQADQNKTVHKTFICYANKRPEEVAYLDDLATVAKSSENITFVPTMDHIELSERSRSGETGVVDQPTLSKYTDDRTAPVDYLCGPPGTVTAIRTLSNGAGVDDAGIRTEEFSGYR